MGRGPPQEETNLSSSEEEDLVEPPRRGQVAQDNRRPEALDIASVIMYYGGERIPTGSGWRKMRCIHGERNPSATINVEEGAFNCFSCGLRGDAITIIRKMENNCTFAEACTKYKEITGQEIAGQSARRTSGNASAAESKNYESGGFLVSRLRKGI